MTAMMKKSAKILLANFVLLAIMLSLAANDSSEVKLTFSSKDNHYEIQSFFSCHVQSMDKLKNMIYDYNHVKEVVKDAYSIEILRNGVNSHELLYRYKYMFWSVDIAFERHLENEKDIISFKMTKFKTSGAFPFPQIISSSGYYKLSRKQNIFYIEYYQATNTGPVIAQEIYLDQVKKSCLNYLIDLKKHIENNDKNNDF